MTRTSCPLSIVNSFKEARHNKRFGIIDVSSQAKDVDSVEKAVKVGDRPIAANGR